MTTLDAPIAPSTARRIETGDLAWSDASPEERARVMREIDPDVRAIVRQRLASRDLRADVEDVEQEVRAKVLTMFGRFEPGERASLRAYLRVGAQRTVDEYATAHGQYGAVNAPATHRRQMRRLMATRARLQAEMGRLPTPREVFDAAPFSERDLDLGDSATPMPWEDYVRNRATVRGAAKWVAQFLEGAANVVRCVDFADTQVASSIGSPEEIVAERERVTRLRAAMVAVLDGMEPRQRVAAAMLRGLGGNGRLPMPPRDVAPIIARRFGVSADEATRIVTRAAKTFAALVRDSAQMRAIAREYGLEDGTEAPRQVALRLA